MFLPFMLVATIAQAPLPLYAIGAALLYVDTLGYLRPSGECHA